MSHRKTLYQLPSFWWAVFTPLVIGLSIAGFIAWHDFFSVESMHACGTSDCINNAISRLKLPIAIMALIFPAVALVASWHRSAQTVAQIERTDKQIQQTQLKNSFENCVKHRELFFSYLEEQEKVLGVKFTDKQFLYERIFCENDFIHFAYYADEMALNKDLVLMNDDKGGYDFQNYFHYVYFILNERIKSWNLLTCSEERKFFHLADNLHTGWLWCGISITIGKSGRSIFEYNSCYINGRFQHDFYLMLSVLQSLEKFCLSEAFQERKTTLYRIEERKFTEDSADFSQCLYTEKCRIRPVLDVNGVVSGYEELPLPEEIIPF